MVRCCKLRLLRVNTLMVSLGNLEFVLPAVHGFGKATNACRSTVMSPRARRMLIGLKADLDRKRSMSGVINLQEEGTAVFSVLSSQEFNQSTTTNMFVTLAPADSA